MKKVLFILLAAAGLSVLSIAHATIITENFSSNPLSDGWQIFGDTNLFQWDSTNHQLAVTWDSSQTNSYFYHPLGTCLTRNDDFSIAFDLRLDDIAAGGYGFEITLGFLNLSEATGANFLRGTSVNSPNLVELDYFPDVGYGPTLWPQFVDTNSDFNYNGESDYALYAPALGDWYHVVMTYTASNQTMVTTITNFEQTSGVTVIDPLDLTNAAYPFTDFRVDTISVSSYSDVDSGGSILAHGIVNNFVVTVPLPPIQNLTNTFNGGIWQVQFISQSNWLYTLERTADFQLWTNVMPVTAGNATNLFLQDPHPPADKAFYRVSATRP